MTGHSKRLIKAIQQLGFQHIWTNSQGFHCFAHPDDPSQAELSVGPSINREQHARDLLRRAQAIAGALPTAPKRNAGQIKERRADERERAQRRLEWAEAKRDRLIAEKADAAWLQKIEELVEHRRQELLALHREMTESPQGSQHRGRGRVEYLGVADDRTPL